MTVDVASPDYVYMMGKGLEGAYENCDFSRLSRELKHRIEKWNIFKNRADDIAHNASAARRIEKKMADDNNLVLYNCSLHAYTLTSCLRICYMPRSDICSTPSDKRMGS